MLLYNQRKKNGEKRLKNKRNLKGRTKMTTTTKREVSPSVKVIAFILKPIVKLAKAIRNEMNHTFSLLDEDPYCYDKNGEHYDESDVRYWGNPDNYTFYEVSKVHPEWSFVKRLFYRNVLVNTFRVTVFSLIASAFFIAWIIGMLLILPS